MPESPLESPLLISAVLLGGMEASDAGMLLGGSATDVFDDTVAPGSADAVFG